MKLFYDYDSTLNDLCEAWITWINKEHDKNIQLSDVTTWEWFNSEGLAMGVDMFAWFNNQQPYDLEHQHTIPLVGAVEFMKQSRELVSFLVRICLLECIHMKQPAHRF